jgi:chromosome segregation ATPase
LLSKYAGQLRSCEMRATILTNELDDARRDLHAVEKKKKVLADASTHLSREKLAVREKMRQLEEELALIDKHLTDQEHKRAVLDEEGQQSAARVELTEHTLSSLHAEMEKLHILVEGLK